MADDAQVKDQVLQSFKELASAAKDLDFNRYIQLFDSDRFSGLNANGTVWGSLDEFASTVRPGFEAIKKIHDLQFPVVQITVINPETVILINEFKQKIELSNGDKMNAEGGGTQVWSKLSGSWKLVSVSASNK